MSDIGPDSTKEEIAGFVASYGRFDGGHHKQWVLHQALLALTGSTDEAPTPMLTKLIGVKVSDEEYFLGIGAPEEEGDYYGYNDGYSWEIGIAP